MGNTEPKHGLLKRLGNVRPPFSPWPEVMCFQADTAGVVLYAIKELKDAGRLTIDSVQKAYIVGMEGTKGKQSFGSNASNSVAAFGKTSTHVFRMVMLEACGIDPGYWPGGGPSSYRNEDKMKYEQIFGCKYSLADSYEEAREYWCEFDKMYPHYLMEKFLEEKTGSLNNIMFIFKNYMQEMVEISMNICASKSTGKKINCCVSATVVHRYINLEGASGPWLDKMALTVRGPQRPLALHYDMLLDLVSCTLSRTELEANLNILYDSLPTKVTEIDDTVDLVRCVENPVESNVNHSFSRRAPPTTAAQARKPDTVREETSTTKVETNIRKTDPVTNEVVETKRVITQRTVTSSESVGEIRETKRNPEKVRQKAQEKVSLEKVSSEKLLQEHTEREPEAIPEEDSEPVVHGPRVRIKDEHLLD